MKRLLAPAALCLLLTASPGFAADEQQQTPPPKQASPEEIRARLAEHARKKAADAAEVAKAEKKDTPATPVPPPAPAAAAPKAATADADAKKAEDDATVLPKVEVRRGKITELDQQLQKQNKEIARERVNTKPTALDETLNGPEVSKALAIFGGQSSDDRANIARERVAMMEEERDLIEAIAQAQTPQEKEELQKTLDDMRAMRRELEQSLR